MPRIIMISLKNGEYTYDPKALIGSGSFGKVFKCKAKSISEVVALKIIEKRKLDQHGDYLFKALEREITIQKLVSKSGIPFFVGLIDDFEDTNNVYMVLEYCQDNLAQFVLKNNPSEQQILELVLHVGLGLSYLHHVNITHRDIKLDNILIKDGIFKLADFGFASNSTQLQTSLGTAPYMSPELFSEKEETYTPKVDVWALNTCLYKLFTGKYFFWSSNRSVMEKMIKTKEFVIGSELEKVSSLTKDLLVKGYIKDQIKRPSMQEYVCHEAFGFLRSKYAVFMQRSFNPVTQPSIKEIEHAVTVSLAGLLQKYRDNCIVYSKLSSLFYVRGHNKVVAFLLLKKHIQNLSAVIISFNKRSVPRTKPINLLGLSQTQWDDLCNYDGFRNLVSVMTEDLTKLTVKYAELFREIQASSQTDNKLASLRDKNDLDQLFDINVAYDEEKLIKYFEDFLNNPNNAKKLGFDEIAELVKRIQTYEYLNCYEMLK